MPPSSELTFPPAPNWFSAHALCSSGQVVAYSAKQDVVLLWHRKKDGSNEDGQEGRFKFWDHLAGVVVFSRFSVVPRYQGGGRKGRQGGGRLPGPGPRRGRG